ncbi:MAG: mechanosensitive ion channel family protein [Prochloraceae cyanobacterium]
MYQQVENILIILAELGVLVLVFFLLNWLALKSLKQVMKIPWLKREENRVQTLRRDIQLILTISCVVLCFLVIGINGYLFYQGKNLKQETLALIYSIPQDFWINLAWALGKCLLIVIVAAQVIRVIHPILNKICDRAKQYDQITANDPSIEAFFRLLDRSSINSIWLLTLAQCTIFLQLPKVVPQNIYLILKIYLIVVFGLAIVKATAVLIDSLDALSDKYYNEDNLLRFYARLRHLVPFLKRCLEYVIYIFIATVALQQVEAIAKLADYGPAIVQIVGIIFMSRVSIEVAKLFVEEIFLKNENLSDFQIQKRQTIIPLIQSGLKYLIYFGAGIVVLYTININPTPILAGAGILGLAVSLGAQNLINDLVSGFFILFENYYLVGDFIETNNASGFVEAIELRTTRIRHPSGQVYIIRNGNISKLVNYSKDYIYAVVQVGVDYDSDLDRVYQIVEEVGKQLKETNRYVLEPTRVDGLDNFGESELTIRTVTKVKPGRHLPIQRVLRKMIKTAFDREGIEIPFARRVLIFKNGEDNNQQQQSNIIRQGLQETPND